jgi:hypothetical protein
MLISLLPFLTLLFLLAFSGSGVLVFFCSYSCFCCGSACAAPGGSPQLLPALLPFLYLHVPGWELCAAGWLRDRYSLEALQSRQGPGSRYSAAPYWPAGLFIGAMIFGVFDLYSTHRPCVNPADNRAVFG